MSGLSETIQSGQHRLDSILDAISEAALHLTHATGAAVAMWKNGAMLCRARSGTTAPPLGATLSCDSGISGECLRTGAILNCEDAQSDSRVDPEVCGTLGLRSIAAVPIVGWHGINGIVEVFATQPHAFNDEHLAWLKQLAGLAEKARALRPHTAGPAVPESGKSDRRPNESPRESARPQDVIFAGIGSRKRRLILGMAGLFVIFILGFVIWVGFHWPDASDLKPQITHGAEPGSALVQSASRDPVLPSRPGANIMRGEKPSAGMSVKLAVGRERIPDSPVPPRPFNSRAAQVLAVQSENPSSARRKTSEISVEAPQLALGSYPPEAVNEFLSSPVQEPRLAIPISQGVSNGYLIHRVAPVYPQEARELRLQGAVRVNAIVSEEGSVETVKLVEGPAVLAKAAIEAIRQWRYKPYQLDGKPVKMATTITVNFRLPQ